MKPNKTLFIKITHPKMRTGTQRVKKKKRKTEKNPQQKE